MVDIEINRNEFSKIWNDLIKRDKERKTWVTESCIEKLKESEEKVKKDNTSTKK
jgi:hypothetical protein